MVSNQPVTEVASLFVKSGTNLEDKDSDAYTVSREALSIIASQPGYQHAYYGHHVEDRSKVDLVIDWDNIECHKRFMTAPEYKRFLEKFNQILDRTPRLFHFSPVPFPPSILASAPCTEVATFYQTSEKFLGCVEKFLKCLEGADGYVGCCFGEVIEEIEMEDWNEKGRAVLLYIGWTGLDKHMAFRETEVFKANVPLLREGRGRVEMYHVAFESV